MQMEDPIPQKRNIQANAGKSLDAQADARL